MSGYGLTSLSSRATRSPEAHEKWKKYKRDKEARRRLRPDVQISIYRQNAKTRSVEFLLTDAEAEQIMKCDCFYCGTPPEPLNGMDRRDNTLGYTSSNTVPACSMCNLMKKNYTEQDFIDHCVKVAEFRSQK